MPEMNVNIVWLLIVAVPSLLATFSAVRNMMKDSGSMDNKQNEDILLLKAEMKTHRIEIERLATRLDNSEVRTSNEIKELEKKIEGRFDQLVTLITSIKK